MIIEDAIALYQRALLVNPEWETRRDRILQLEPARYRHLTGKQRHKPNQNNDLHPTSPVHKLNSFSLIFPIGSDINAIVRKSAKPFHHRR